jgi:hypothetical protein
MESKSAWNSALFYIHIEFLYYLLAPSANFEDEIEKTAKKWKSVFYELVLELIFSSINGLGEPSC